MIKRVKKLLIYMLIAIMALLPTHHAFADEGDEDELQYEQYLLEQQANDTEDSIAATREEFEAAKLRLKELKDDIDKTNNIMKSVSNRLKELDGEIKESEVRLAQKQWELEKAKEDMSSYYQELKGRIQMMYECDQTTYLEILLSASSLSDFFSRYEYVSMMVAYDNAIMEKLADCKQTIEDSKVAIEETTAELEKDKEEQLQKQEELASALLQKKQKYAEIEDDALVLMLLLEEQSNEREEIQARISSLQSSIDDIEEQKQAEIQQAMEESENHESHEDEILEDVSSEENSESSVMDTSETESSESSSEQESAVQEESSLQESSSEENTEDSSSEPENSENSEVSEMSENSEESSQTEEDSDDNSSQNNDSGEDSSQNNDSGAENDSDANSENNGDDNGNDNTGDDGDDDDGGQVFAGDSEDYRANEYGWYTWPGIGTGELGWPVNSSIATDLFGPRIHPITGDYKNHDGLDLGAGYGSPIYASLSGTVIYTATDDWGGGYGNYVMIDHGNGFVTLYAHQSEVACAVGDYVEQGQVIGYVGSTGISTGPHLHFEVYLYGSLVNPEDYL